MSPDLIKEHEALIVANRYYNVEDSFWHLGIFENFEEDVEKVGIAVARDLDDNRCIYFSGFASQGDGAVFEGRVCDWARLLPALGIDNPALAEYADAFWYLSWTHSGRYYHEQSWEFHDQVMDPVVEEGFTDDDPFVVSVKFTAASRGPGVDEIVGMVREYLIGLMKGLYKDLEDEYDYLTSDEAVLEALIAYGLTPETQSHQE